MKKGISLIVLVITVIVMVILAAAVVITLSNTGIINKANVAVNKTSLKQVEQLASIAWAESYAEGKTSVSELKAAVDNSLEDNKIDVSKYNIEVTDTGVKVTEKNSGNQPEKNNPVWRIEKTKNAEGIITKIVATDGTTEYEIGSTINYMPEGVGPNDAKYTGGWKLLGVDDQGRMLIMSNASVTGSEITLPADEEVDNDGVGILDLLQDSVSEYKDGTLGILVRSITIEDVDNITGFDKTNFSNLEFAELMGEDVSSMSEEEIQKLRMSDYGTKVTFSWDGTYKPKYTFILDGKTITGNTEYTFENDFIYYNETAKRYVISEYENGVSKNIATLEANFYAYFAEMLLDSNTKAYKMLFLNHNDNSLASYRVASWYTDPTSDGPGRGLRMVVQGGVYGRHVVWCDIGKESPTTEVRAVVTLSPNAKLTESEIITGTYDVSLAE